MLTFSIHTGADAVALAPHLARLHVECLSGWPHFAVKTIDYTAKYRASLTASAETNLVVLARDGDAVVGATAGMKLPKDLTEVVAALDARGMSADRAYWITQMTILGTYRGTGVSNTLSYMREDHARGLGVYDHIVFSALVRPADHPLRPSDYVPYDGMWNKRGYRHLEGADMRTRFVDSLDRPSKPTDKVLQLWVKDLT